MNSITVYRLVSAITTILNSLVMWFWKRGSVNSEKVIDDTTDKMGETISKTKYKMQPAGKTEAEQSIRNRFVISIEKPNLAEAINETETYANLKAESYKTKYLSIMMVISALSHILVGKILAGFLAVSAVVPLILLQENELAEMTALLTSGSSIGSKILVLIALICKMMKIKWAYKLIMQNLASLNFISFLLDSDMNHGNWERYQRKYFGNRTHTIDKYWRDLGLEERYNGVIFEMTEPIEYRVQKEQLYADINKRFSAPDYVLDILKMYGHAVADDKDLVAAINKRLTGLKKQAETAVMIEFAKNMMEEFSGKKASKSDIVAKIKHAMGTQGSAGEFAKHTIYELSWKDKNSEMMVEIWTELTQKMHTCISLGMNLPTEYTDYMLYRKIEILEIEDGKVKTMRIVQAPNLLIRMADVVLLHDFNNMIVSYRHTTIPVLGLNIYKEMSLIFEDTGQSEDIDIDFSNYDGTHNPFVMMVPYHVRLAWGIKYQDMTYNEMNYLKWKYELLNDRVLRAKGNIRIDLCGTLASGDGTTSDDNTMKTATICITAAKRTGLKFSYKKLQIGEYRAWAQGDDLKVRIKASKEVVTEFVGNMAYIVNGLGMTFKKIDRSLATNLTEFLSHSVIMKNVILNPVKITKTNTSAMGENSVLLTTTFVCRKEPKMLAKLFLSGEKNRLLTSEGRMSTSAKMLSYSMMGISSPTILIIASIILILLRAAPDEEKLKRDEWRRGIKSMPRVLSAETILGVHCEINENFAVAIADEEKGKILSIIKWIQSDLANEIIGYELLIKKAQKIISTGIMNYNEWLISCDKLVARNQRNVLANPHSVFKNSENQSRTRTIRCNGCAKRLADIKTELDGLNDIFWIKTCKACYERNREKAINSNRRVIIIDKLSK